MEIDITNILFLGVVPQRRRWPREHDRGRAGSEHPPGRQFPGISAEKALAERPLSLHQEHNGTAPEAILGCSTVREK